MSDHWPGIVNAIFHHTQFETELDDEVVGRIARALIENPLGSLTAVQEYDALAAGLARKAPLPSRIPMRRTEADLREFLARIVARMDERRPWAEPAFTPLPDEDLERFRSARPIARIRMSVPDAQARLGQGFAFSDDGPYLLLRLRSGVIIGLFTPVWDGSDDLLLASPDAGTAAGRIVDELTQSGRLDPRQITLLGPGDIDALRRAPYETTPIQPEFRGEDRPGNTVWGGKQVRYLGPEDRREFELTPHNGRLFDSRGLPYDTAAAQTLWTPQGGRAIFVMDEYGTVYSATYHLLGEFHHSSFLAGAPAAGAGEIAVRDGEVLLISDQSSHYRPARRFTAQVVDSLRNQGLDTGSIRVEYHSPV